MPKKDTTKNIILYVIEKLGQKVEGKKKLMKLMFLIEHYDIETKKLSSNNYIGNNFYIYHYGVFSLDIMNYVNELIKEGIIKEGFPLKSNEKGRLDSEIKERVDKVINKFGLYSGYELELDTLTMLGIERKEKKLYFGESITTIMNKLQKSSA